jgi:prolyl-tRNA synthetase
VQAGVDACLDDRKVTPGVKFKDLDLLGFPVQVVVGRKAEDGVVELNVRKTGAKAEIAAGDVVERVRAALAECVGTAAPAS